MKRKIIQVAILLCVTLEIGGCSSQAQTSMEESSQSDSIQQINDTIATEVLDDSDSSEKENDTSSDSNIEENIEILSV